MLPVYRTLVAGIHRYFVAKVDKTFAENYTILVDHLVDTSIDLLDCNGNSV